MKIILNNERPMSWNKIYAGQHWSVRKEEADRVHLMIKAALGRLEYIINSPVKIVITAYFENRPLDPDNIASKFYIDGLKGLIKDDRWCDVLSVTTISRKDPNKPRVEIEIEED